VLVLLVLAGPALAANITSIGTGNWSATGTWSGGSVPTAADNVTIANGHTVTIDVTSASCLSLTVGQGVSGVLQFSTATARTLTVGGDVTIAAGGTFQSATGGTVTTHALSVAGNLTNNGTLDFSTASNAAGASITFTGASNTSFSGTGATTDIRALTVNKGTTSASILELMPSSFTVQGTSTDGTPSAFLTLTNGTLKISGTFTGTHRTFGSATYTIPTTCGLWLNNPNYAVAGQNGSPTNNGLLRVTQGTMNVGSASGNQMGAGTGAVFTIEGGTLNLSGRLLTSNAITYNQSGGTVNVTTVGNGSNNSAGLELSSASNTVSMSGGTIVLVQASTATNKRDYLVNAGTVSITGGTLQVGKNTTATNFGFQIAGWMPNLVVDNTTNTKTATVFTGTPASQALDVTINTGSTLNLNGFTLTTAGTTFTNNGTLTGTLASSQLYFLNASQAQTYTGTGTVTVPLDGIAFDSPSGVTISSGSSSIVTLNARLYRGTVANSNKLSLGNGGTSAAQTVIGRSGLATAAGAYDVAPTFSAGTGGYSVSYQPEGASRTTGLEIPGSRTIQNLTVNNANGVTLSGGNLTANGSVTINGGTSLNLNGLTVTMAGATFTNNGTLTGTASGSTLSFLGSAAQSYTGTGAVTSPLYALSFDTPAGVTINSAVSPNITALTVSLYRGTVTNSNKLTLGNGGSTAAQTVIGRTGLATTAGSYGAAPTFNAGTGGYSVSYQPEGGARSTGLEIPASRSVANVTVNNANGVSLAGGSLTIGGVLTFTSGNLGTGANTLALTATGSVARTSGHVVGNLRKNVATGSAVSRSFEIGTGSDYTPVDVQFASVTTAGDLTATTVAGDHPNLSGSLVNPNRSVNRYWTLSNGGVGFSTYDITLNFVAGDIDPGSSTSNFVVTRYNSPTWFTTTTGTRTATSTQATGVAAFSDFAVGENSHVITASAGANGSISPPGAVVVQDGASQMFAITPAACYRVSDVLVDGVSVGPVTAYTFTNVTANHTISASFVNLFTITASAGVHGSISPSGVVSLVCGANQSFTITANPEFHVADVLVDGVSVGAVTSYTFTNVNADHTIAASFAYDNNPPVLSGIPASATIPELVAYTFTATATDVESPPEALTFSLVGAPAGASIDGTSGVFTWTPGEPQGPGTYPFTVRVTDGQWNTDAPITLTVTEANLAPALSGVPATATIAELAAYTFTAGATDDDLPAQALVFSLVGAPAGAAIDPGTGVFAWTPSEAQGPGSYPFTVRVSDGTANTDAAITLTVNEVNTAPSLPGVPATATIPEVAAYTLNTGGTDPDIPVQTLVFSLAGAPAGAAIDPGTGILTWTPSETQGPGSYPFTVQVTDGVVLTQAAITLTVSEVNVPPLLSGVPSTATLIELAPYTFATGASDEDVPAQTLTFSLVGAPPGAAIDPGTGVFTWTPGEAQGPGSYPFTVRLSDGVANTDAAITLTVDESNVPPALSGVPASATLSELAAYTFAATATDPDLPAQTLTFSLVGAPSGAAIGAGTGVFTWTPSEAQGPGSYPFTVRVSDGAANADAAITLTVDEVNVSPVLSGVPASATIPELSAYTFTAHASDVDLPVQPLTFSLVGAPTGASIDGSTGVFTWTPGAAQAGVHPFTVRVSDGMSNTEAGITITVSVLPITNLTATQIKSGNDGDGTTRIRIDWPPAPSGHTVEVFRAGFGGYPTYDGAGGQVPATPPYPPGAPWVLTPITAPGAFDEVAARDFYYYVAFVHGAGSTVSVVSNRTAGTLNYHLGDVSDGATPGQGDNSVTTADLSLLGAHYALEGAEAAPYAYLDVGPTTDYSMDALPTTDGVIDFEDLIVLAINVDAVSAPAGPALAGSSLAQTPAANALAREAEGSSRVGETLRCPIRLSNTGMVQGLSVSLAWDPTKVRPLAVEAGEWMVQSGGLVLSPRPGTVDAAFLGPHSTGGEGVLATVRFLTLAAGDPGIRIASVDARDAANRKIDIPVSLTPLPRVIPIVTSLALAAPNPFRDQTVIAFDLAQSGPADLTIYSAGGRRVRTLLAGTQEPGEYHLSWDGRDEHGNAVGAGVYYMRLVAGGRHYTRPIVRLR